MTIETYYNFLKIVECGSILSASQELMIAQPALSTQLKNLENHLGVKLMERGTKQVALTPAGEIFYKKAQVICSVNDSMYSEIKNYINGTAGMLKLSMPPTNPDSLLHKLFDKFIESHPNVTFQITEALSNQVADNVLHGISEIGMIRSPVKNLDKFHLLPYMSEEMMVLLSTSNPLSRYDSLTLEQIKNEPIATTDVLAPMIAQAFHRVNAEPNFLIKTSNRRVAVFWISNYKNCICILPCSREDLVPEPGCKILPISDYDFSVGRTFIILRNRKLSPVAREFLNGLDISCDFPDV